MTKTSTYAPPFRRRRKGKTNYAKRLAMLKAGKVRFVVRRSSNTTTVQAVKYKRHGDVTVATANSKELAAFGWKLHTGNLPAAYLTGLLCGAKAAKAGVGEAIADIGLNTPVHGSAVFAAVKGGIDAGLSIPSDSEVFPSDERISGKHIKEYASKLGGEQKKRFSKSIAAGAKPEGAVEYFTKAREAMLKKYGIKIAEKAGSRPAGHTTAEVVAPKGENGVKGTDAKEKAGKDIVKEK